MKRRLFAVVAAAAAILAIAFQPAQRAAAATPAPGSTSGQYVIRFDNSQKCLDDPNSSHANGTALEQWTCNHGSNQNWYLDYITSTTFRIRSEASGLCVNIKGATYVNNTAIIQWPCLNVANETFKFALTPLDQPPYSWNWIEPASKPSMALNVKGASAANGAAIILYSTSDSTNEYTRIIAPPPPPPQPQAPPCSTSSANWHVTGSYNQASRYSDWMFAYLGPVGDVEVQYQWGVNGSYGGLVWSGDGPCLGLTINEHRAITYRLRFMDDDCHCVLTEDSSGWIPISGDGEPALSTPAFGELYYAWDQFLDYFVVPTEIFTSPPS